jgi:hypothetical protein
MAGRSLVLDRRFGAEGEKIVLELIQKHISPTIEAAPNKFSPYDFVDKKEGIYYELKSRRCMSSEYDTTLLPANKILKPFCKQKFLFNFTDGLFYIDYEEEAFRLYKTAPFMRGGRGGITDKQAEYVYIPVKDLKRLIEI